MIFSINYIARCSYQVFCSYEYVSMGVWGCPELFSAWIEIYKNINQNIILARVFVNQTDFFIRTLREKGFSHNDSYSHVKAFVYRHLMRNFKKALIVSWFIFIFLTLSFVYFSNREWKLLLLWSFNVNLQSNLNCNWDSKLFISTCIVTVATLLEVAVNDNCQ